MVKSFASFTGSEALLAQRSTLPNHSQLSPSRNRLSFGLILAYHISLLSSTSSAFVPPTSSTHSYVKVQFDSAFSRGDFGSSRSPPPYLPWQSSLVVGFDYQAKTTRRRNFVPKLRMRDFRSLVMHLKRCCHLLPISRLIGPA